MSSVAETRLPAHEEVLVEFTRRASVVRVARVTWTDGRVAVSFMFKGLRTFEPRFLHVTLSFDEARAAIEALVPVLWPPEESSRDEQRPLHVSTNERKESK